MNTWVGAEEEGADQYLQGPVPLWGQRTEGLPAQTLGNRGRRGRDPRGEPAGAARATWRLHRSPRHSCGRGLCGSSAPGRAAEGRCRKGRGTGSWGSLARARGGQTSPLSGTRLSPSPQSCPRRCPAPGSGQTPTAGPQPHSGGPAGAEEAPERAQPSPPPVKEQDDLRRLPPGDGCREQVGGRQPSRPECPPSLLRPPPAGPTPRAPPRRTARAGARPRLPRDAARAGARQPGGTAASEPLPPA